MTPDEAVRALREHHCGCAACYFCGTTVDHRHAHLTLPAAVDAPGPAPACLDCRDLVLEHPHTTWPAGAAIPGILSLMHLTDDYAEHSTMAALATAIPDDAIRRHWSELVIFAKLMLTQLLAATTTAGR